MIDVLTLKVSVSVRRIMEIGMRTCQPGHRRILVSEKRGGPLSVDRISHGRGFQLRILTITWSHPARWIMLATSLAVIGARLLSFLSCRAYGNRGITAVIRLALAILQA